MTKQQAIAELKYRLSKIAKDAYLSQGHTVQAILFWNAPAELRTK